MLKLHRSKRNVECQHRFSATILACTNSNEIWICTYYLFVSPITLVLLLYLCVCVCVCVRVGSLISDVDVIMYLVWNIKIDVLVIVAFQIDILYYWNQFACISWFLWNKNHTHIYTINFIKHLNINTLISLDFNLN